MASPEAIAETSRHRSACVQLSVSSRSEEIKILALAIEDSNKWLDDGYTDLRKILNRLSVVESALAEANDEIRRLKASLRA